MSSPSAAARRATDVKFVIHAARPGMHVDSQSLEASGARVLATYAEGHAVAVPAQAREAFLGRFAAFDLRELEDIIYTPRRPIDPRSEVPPPAPATAGLFLLQYVAPATPAWQAAVRASGVIEVQPLPERAIVVAAAPEQIAALARLPWVQYAGPYGREYKFAPAGADHGEFVIQIADNELSGSAIEYVEGVAGGFLTRTSSDGILTARIATGRGTAETLLDEPFVLGVETYVKPSPSDERQALSLTGGRTLAEAVTIANTGIATGTNYRKWLNKYGFAQPVKIVLAWTDKEGAVQDPASGGPFRALVNDLDLIAQLPQGAAYYGNFTDAATGYSRMPGGCGRPSCPTPADTRNNVEVVHINPADFVNAANHTFSVRVWAANLNGAGVPGAAGGAYNQDFAIFVINGSLTPQ